VWLMRCHDSRDFLAWLPRESNKTGHSILVHNLAKYWPIFTIL